MKTDTQLRQDILDELCSESNIDASEIGVFVHNGVVILSGSVPSYMEKSAVKCAARRASGVKADNVLTLVSLKHRPMC